MVKVHDETDEDANGMKIAQHFSLKKTPNKIKIYRCEEIVSLPALYRCGDIGTQEKSLSDLGHSAPVKTITHVLYISNM